MKFKRFFVMLGVTLIVVLLRVPCPIRYVTGLYCPGCGTGRMIRALLRLDIISAFKYQPIVFIAMPLLMIDILMYNENESRVINVLNIVFMVALVMRCIYMNISMNI